MGKKKKSVFWVRCEIIRVKKFKGGGSSYLARDLTTDATVWLPTWLVVNATPLPGKEHLMCITDDFKSKSKMGALTREQIAEYRARSEAA